MPYTRLQDRSGVSQHSVDQGQTVVQFENGVADHLYLRGAGGPEDLSSLFNQHPSVVEIGRPGLATAISADLSAESEITVPSGRYWRVIGGFLQYTASADVATRTPIVTLEDDAGNAYATITISTKTASQVENDHFLAGSDGKVAGNNAVAAQGKLTVAVNPTDEDTMTIDAITYTFVASDDGSVSNAILIGANVGATQDNIEAALVDGNHPTVNAAAFNANEMILTARTPGVAGDAIVTTETFTSGSNVFDGTTLGTTTAGADAADDILSIDFPEAGVLLVPGEVIALNVTNGHANDAAELAIFFIEFDADPSPA